MQADAGDLARGVKRLQLRQRVCARPGDPLGDEAVATPSAQGFVALNRADGFALEVIDQAALHAVALHFRPQAGGVGKRRGPVVAVADADVGVEDRDAGAEAQVPAVLRRDRL